MLVTKERSMSNYSSCISTS